MNLIGKASGGKAKILIADDHFSERDYLKTVLGYAGHQVLEAADGVEALDLICSQRPDLVITDILMPKLDGLELVRQIRSRPDIAATRVIIWSATFRQEEAQALAGAMGVARLMKKPVEPGTLLATVDAILGAPPPAPVAAAVLTSLEEAHQRLLNDKLYKKTLELEEEIAARLQIEAVLRESQQRLEESEARFRRMADSAPVLIWMSGDDKRCTWFNRPWLEFTGRTREQELDEGWAEGVHPDDLGRCLQIYETAFDCRMPFAMEYRLRRYDGEYRWIYDQGVPRFEAGGAFSGYIGSGVDITDRKQAEQALIEGEHRLAMALKAGGSAVWEMELATGMITGDDSLFAMYGYAPGELKTLADWESLVQEDDRPSISEKINDAIYGKADGYSFEARLRCKDGTLRWNLSQATVAERDAKGEALRVVGTHTDIDARKRAEEEIQRLNAELEQRVRERTVELERSNEALLHSNMELQQFSHATAHDLQTPLRSIAGFAQLLQRKLQESPDEQAREYSSLVIDNTKRLQTLIDNLLAYARLEAQGLPLEPVDLRDVADNVVASLAVLIKETGAELHCEHLPTLPADRLQITQVFQNLIENGIKYNTSRPPRITIGSDFQDDEWVFSVSDNGIGIDPRHHERIFELFRRLHTYSRIPGTGIGLALCRRIVERHGGRIWVESQPGVGSTFYFTLPARAAAMESRRGS